MRVVLAGLFVVMGMLAVVGALGALGVLDSSYGWAANIGILPLVFLLTAFAVWLFSPRHAGSGKTHEEYIRELEEQGLILDEHYRATRAFAVEEFEDEGSTYYVELADGRVLFLQGQYLYDYEPIEDDPEYNQPRTFPCTEFTLRRHREKGHIVDLLCAGRVFEPEITAPHFGEEIYSPDFPQDGDIIAGQTYDELKADRLARRD